MRKIITHAGTHHADEVLAIATIYHFLGDEDELPIERNFRPSDEDFKNPEIFVLDVGRKLEPSKGNFDHHQDGEIPATNMLILEHLCKDEKLKDLLKKYLFSYVDAVDRGHILEGKEEEFSTPSINSVIRNLNNVEGGFEIALQVAKTALTAAIATAEKAIESEDKWRELAKEGKIAIQHDTDFIVGWRELAEAEDVLVLISPNIREKGAYQISSRDTDILKIPVHPKQTFLHANQFIAAYPDLDSALNHAREFVK